MTAPAVSPLRRLAPALAWAVLILVLTSVPGRDVPDVHIAQIDKVVHVSLYAVLAVLLRVSMPALRTVGAHALIVASASLFGAADEWHQQFIPGRSQDRYDWLADTIGAGAGVLFTAAARARRESAS